MSGIKIVHVYKVKIVLQIYSKSQEIIHHNVLGFSGIF